jgi:acyl-CoA thioesterase FadM
VNLYLRLIGVLLRSLGGRRRNDPLAVDVLRLWVRPWDCDVNRHMNNGRYLTVMDLGRVSLMGAAGILWPTIRRGWFPVVSAADLHFFGSLHPFERFTLETQVLGWDARWFYLEQRFVARGRLLARGWVKSTFFHGRRPVPPADVVALAGFSGAAPALPAAFERWAQLHSARRAGAPATAQG